MRVLDKTGGIRVAIHSVDPSTQKGIANAAAPSRDASSGASTTGSIRTASNEEAAVYEKSKLTTPSAKTYTRDAVKLDEINRQVETKLSSLRAAVENLVAMQSVKTGEAKGLSYDQIMKKYEGKLKDFYQNLQVDDATRLKAQQDISTDGFWGIKQTSERAIEFAKALSGGDPSKISLLRNSIIEAYKAAEKTWGGELPEICRQTQEATLKGLDDWAQEAAQMA